MIEFQLIGMPGNPIYRSLEALHEAAAAFGLTLTASETPSPHLSATLQGLPRFKELMGPMGGSRSAQGVTLIRYETHEANKFYST